MIPPEEMLLSSSDFLFLTDALEKKRDAEDKILIVEDEPIMRDLCDAVLRTGGFHSIATTNGMEGLEVYRERHEEIGLVLSDISMPLMNGLEMVRKIFEIHSCANVILMSAHHLCTLIPDEVRRLCSVIEKPFTPGHLLEAVKRCLKYDEEHHPSPALAN